MNDKRGVPIKLGSYVVYASPSIKWASVTAFEGDDIVVVEAFGDTTKLPANDLLVVRLPMVLTSAVSMNPA